MDNATGSGEKLAYARCFVEISCNIPIFKIQDLIINNNILICVHVSCVNYYLLRVIILIVKNF